MKLIYTNQLQLNTYSLFEKLRRTFSGKQSKNYQLLLYVVDVVISVWNYQFWLLNVLVLEINTFYVILIRTSVIISFCSVIQLLSVFADAEYVCFAHSIRFKFGKFKKPSKIQISRPSTLRLRRDHDFNILNLEEYKVLKLLFVRMQILINKTPQKHLTGSTLIFSLRLLVSKKWIFLSFCCHALDQLYRVSTIFTTTDFCKYNLESGFRYRHTNKFILISFATVIRLSEFFLIFTLPY